VSARAYLLLNIVQGKSGEAARLLRDEVGVIAVDMLEGPPDIIVLITASGRSTLARLTVRAIASVEALTQDIQLLPVQDAPKEEKRLAFSRRYRQTTKCSKEGREKLTLLSDTK
jgi:hypothetical protein